MSFALIAIKTSIPVTAPAATSGALTFSTIEDENWLQITGDASAGSGSLYVLRWNADLAEWRPYMEDKPIAVDSTVLNGLFSAYYPFPKGEESFVLYDPASAITATASAARTGSPLAAPTPASSGASGGATEAKQDAGNASLVSILGQLDNKTSTLATASAQTTGNSSLSSIDGKVATAAKQDTGNTSLSSIDSKVATAANQTTANSSLASILGQLDSKTSTLATEATVSASKTLLGAGLPVALVGGKLDVNLGTSSITLPVSGPLTDAQLRAIAVPVSQGAGSGNAATFWYTRNTDGTNTQPTMDTAARSGFQRITDGTNTAAVKAASTAAVAPDPAVVVAVSPNNNVSIVGTGTPGVVAGGVLSVQGVSGGSNLNVAQATASNLNATVVQATASNLNATVVGGAANAAAVSGNPVLVAGYDGTNAHTLRTDSSGSIYAAGGSSYNTNGVNETRTVRTGAGVLIRLVINPGTSATFVCYDNTAGSGTVLCALTTGSAGGNGYSVEVGATFKTGLTYVSTGGCNVTLVYRAF